MLYTSVPLERVYHNFREENKPKEKNGPTDHKNNTEDGYKEVMLKHGRIVTKRDGDNDIIQKVYSTDMGDYLNEKYIPGKQYKE